MLEISHNFSELVNVNRNRRLLFDGPDGRLPLQALTSTCIEQSEDLKTRRAINCEAWKGEEENTYFPL